MSIKRYSITPPLIPWSLDSNIIWHVHTRLQVVGNSPMYDETRGEEESVNGNSSGCSKSLSQREPFRGRDGWIHNHTHLLHPCLIPNLGTCPYRMLGFCEPGSLLTLIFFILDHVWSFFFIIIIIIYTGPKMMFGQVWINIFIISI